MRQAGVRLERRNFPKFQEALVAFAQASLTPDDLVPTLHVDGEVMLAMLSRPLVKEIEMLAPLGDNGGPPQTMALRPGRPAIDAGIRHVIDEAKLRPLTTD